MGNVENSALAWFCVRSQPKHEHIATANLRRLQGLEILNPRIRFKRASVRGPVWVTESLFPSYIFARFDLELGLETVCHTPGVAGVVHFGSFWPSIPDATISELQQLLGDDEVRIIEKTFRVGDEVEVASGAFAGFQGVITRVMPAQERVAVLLEFLGRQTVVQVGVDAIIMNGLKYGSRAIHARALA